MKNKNWFKNAIIYQILIDRFAGFKTIKDWDKPNFIGGNIKGIISNFDYLLDLGVNTIWLSPFYETSEYHGYHITDFYKVDPHFGTIDDLKSLIKKVHDNNMRIITDFVPNHCSNIHPFFKDAQENKESDYRDWFYFNNWPENYLCFLSVKQLPKINLENKKARDYIINSAKHWLSLGIDGYRLDHVIGPSHRFWKKFSREIKDIFPNSVLIGEAWLQGIKFNELKTVNIKNKNLKWLFGSSPDFLLKEYVKELDGVLDFKFQELIRDYIVREKINKNKFLKQMKKHYKRFPENYFLAAFIDNHDMDRFSYECNYDLNKIKNAIKIQFSINQPVIIYYGDEIPLKQNKSIWEYTSHGDIQARYPMIWNYKNKELFNFLKKLIQDKNKNNI